MKFQEVDMESNNAIVLLSGGLDSAMCLAELSQLESKYQVVKTLTFNYGQRAFKNEKKAAEALSNYYHVEHQVIDLSWYQDLLPEAMDKSKPFDWNNTSENDSSFFEAKPVWIPNRNGVMLNIAAAFAEALNAKAVAFGANAEEAVAFPDNTLEYQAQLTKAFTYSTLNHVEVICPVGTLSKQQMIQRAREIKMPLELIWSCYTDNDTPCGSCPSCYRVNQALSAI